MTDHQTVLILDFGSQFTQLIARRVRENRVYCEVHPFNVSVDEIRRRQPIGIVLSGGPQSTYDEGAPNAPAELFQLQGKLARRNFDAMVAYSSKSTEAVTKLANEAFAPISGRISLAASKISKAA